MSSDVRKQRTAAIAKADERLLAELGYKQEFQRAFTPLEVYIMSSTTYIFPLIFPKRYSGSRSVLLGSCPLSRQSVPPFHSRHYLPLDYIQLSLVLLRS
jgi:hypothetical protein